MQRVSSYASKPAPRYLELKEQLSSHSFYLVKKCGPTVFNIKDEEGEIFRIVLGNPHSCTCTIAKNTADSSLCVHKVFVILKIMRVIDTNPIAWQTALTDGEITQMLDGVYSPQRSTRGRREFVAKSSSSIESAAPSTVQRQDVGNTDDDICPICQELMNTDQALSW
jgi:hypothetical protein